MAATRLIDPEFGDITIRRVSRTRHVRLRVLAHGRLSATMPRLAPLYVLKKLVDDSRDSLRKALDEASNTAPPLYRHGDRIGASHQIVMTIGTRSTARVSGQTIHWSITASDDPTSIDQQAIIRRAVRKALDVEAKAYLPRRLAYLAELYGFHYASVRYSNAKGRWGSCSSQGVISLNVALMRLPMEYVDYVLLHELCHTLHLNHSSDFWTEVARCYPDHKAARKQLKTYNPYL